MATDRPTLGDLRASGYKVESVKDEMRRNLIASVRSGKALFPDILGYEETVVPQIQNAIHTKHDMLFIGLRGPAKTRKLRQLVHLHDDAIPVVEGSEVNDNPFAPLSKEARDKVAAMGDATPDRLGRPRPAPSGEARHPDVTIADLIGEVGEDQARRGPVSLQRADHAFWPDPRQPVDILHERIA